MAFPALTRAARRALARPGLLAWSAMVAALDAATVFAFLAVATGRELLPVVALFAGQRLLAVVVLSVTLPASYALYRHDRDAAGDREAADPDGDRDADRRSVVQSLRRVGAAIGGGAPRLLASSFVTRLVAVPAILVAAVVLGGLVLWIDTGAVWANAVLDAPLNRGILALAGLAVTVLGAAWLVDGVLAHQDLLALERRAGPLDAWRASAVATTAAPRRLVSGSLLRGLLLSAPWIAGFVALVGFTAATTPPGTDDAGFAALIGAIAVFLLVAAPARAVLVGLHVEAYERRILPALGEAGGSDDGSPADAPSAEGRPDAADAAPAAGRPRREHPLRAQSHRIALAAVVLLAAVAGVAAVRHADVGPPADVPDAAIDPGDADATVSTAIERTLRRDFAYSFEQVGYDESAGRWRTLFDGEGRLDRDGHEGRAALALHVPPNETRRATYYGADGIYAVRAPSGRIRLAHPFEVRRTSGNWSVAVGRPFDAFAGDAEVLPRESTGWHRVASDHETVTYAMDDLDTLGDLDLTVTRPDASDEAVTVLNETGARIVVDRDTATVRRFTVRTHYRTAYGEDDPDLIRNRVTLSITAVGDVTVDRPGGLAGPGPLERAWDVVFYG